MVKILIVDDRESNLFALENVLKRLDVEIIKALSGDEALRATLNQDFALAILDVQMPGMDGYELASFLRNDNRTRSIPIIFLSAVYSEEPYVFKGYESGAVDFITKPFHSEVLLSKVNIFLELAEQKAELVSRGARLQTVISELEQEVDARRRTEEEVLRTNALLGGMNRMLREAIICETEEELAKTCLAVAEEITGSTFGFIGEIDEKGLFYDIALSDPGRVACRMPKFEAGVLVHDMEIRDIWGKVLRDAKSLIVNDPLSHPVRTRIPAGHPVLKCFMGVPLKRGDKTFGMIALGDKEQGYDQADALAVESLALAFVEALSRKKAEDQIRKAHDSLEEKVRARTLELRNEIEERKRVEEQIRFDEARFEALYNLTQMTEAADEDIIEFVLEEQLKITKSKVGTVDFLTRDGKTCVVHGWSKAVMKDCRMIETSRFFDLKEAGVWAQALRDRNPVIINDYSVSHPGGKGYPEGHIELHRLMSIPVFDGETIVAIAVVGNKREAYSPSDVRQLSLLMDGMWKLLKRREIEETRKTYMTRLEQSNRELEDFAFVASHDLQEPLRKIQTFADRLRKIHHHSLTEKGHDYLEIMQRSAARMQDLIIDLLKYSRVTTKPQPFGRVCLTQLAEDAVTDLKVLMEETGGAIEIGELPSIEADGVQMRQLFQNLIGNALKYHGKDEPFVKVHCLASCTNGYFNIHVEDNGIGFHECFLEKIFKPFQRLHGRNSIYQGNGMGLAICRRIVERHGGSITARSEPGKGATFIIILPVTQQLESTAP